MRTPAFLLPLALALLVTIPALDARADRLVEDRDKNYSLTIPDDWIDLPFESQWTNHGIVYGAKRELGKLEDGSPGAGEGGWVHLAITEPPKDADIDAIASDKDVRSFLMSGFSDPWPEIEIIPSEFDEGIPIRVLVAEGPSPNLKGKDSPTRAVMLLTVVHGKLYKLRMFAWTTEHDDESIKTDLDLMEMNFDIPDKTEKKVETEGPPPDLEMPEEEEVVGDEGEEKVFENPALGWKLVKPVGLASKDYDVTDPAYDNIVAWFEGNKPIGSYQIIFYVIRRGRVVDGRQVPDEDLRRWALDGWWARFTAAHPKGELAFWEWPRRSKTFLVLPVFGDDDARDVLFEDPEKRPIEADSGDLMKKLKIAEKVKNQRLGEEKTIEAYRANLEGKRGGGVGREIVMRYTWGTARITCMLVVSLTRDAHKKWEEPINKLLGSIEMTDR